MSRLFCFGLGYTGQALATALRADGWSVAGTCRGAVPRAALSASGFEAYLFDRSTPLSAQGLARLSGASHLLSTVPPDAGGDPVLDVHGEDIARACGLVWVGYLSTTGVYGDRGGAWVDEETAPEPTTERGRRRLAAEEGWLGLWRERKVPVHLFRLAGIYGPGRNPLRAVRDGTARRIGKPGQVFSRIHVDDIVQTLRASMARPRPGGAYNLCDDEAAPPQEVVAYAAELTGREPPPLEDFHQAALTPMARSFYEENKRVRNGRIKRELGVRLGYPDYRTGLKALKESGE